ncbi:PR domain zinc finger protein 5-like isoform X2 [Galleria mellonella]|uniref:PR domain zinc finger protein 5-like isoform X2 n=1 Tax=Galleria mellonella TaxID=7137 RepID=A0ABM3MUE0_GALME|nr:PR domain zinc finger protein 5-like isoform X2 [Galleria mellonella]
MAYFLVANGMKYLCSYCVEKLEAAVSFKEQTIKNMAVIQSIKEEEYLDEAILEEADSQTAGPNRIQIHKKEPADNDYNDDIDEEHAIQALDETSCIYCNLQFGTVDEVHDHIRNIHELEPRTGQKLRECALCGICMRDPADHLNRCHGVKSESGGRQYPCHFCDNIYNSKKACFTHLRMKHGLKLCNDQTPKYTPRERKKCHMCNRDFSQKQILNKHLWKAHGFEVEKRKAFTCPLCDERVSYGSHFSAHLLHEHTLTEQVEQLEFYSMDDFMLFKSAVQEETKYRFRKTTASKQTIEGIRSHYMCSQSGVYVYQGKGKRPAPERQIYKTGKACPAHMIVTETLDRVLVTFYKTHVGHGPCPYFEPRESKKQRLETSEQEILENGVKEENDGMDSWICDACGMGFLDRGKFNVHVASHRLKMFPCQYCEEDFQELDAWTCHVRTEHNMASLF